MSTRRTNAERTESTRAQLISTARGLFSERGYASTTIAEIAKSAGLTTGALYHHWAGKEDLLAAVVHDLHRELAGRIRAQGDQDDPVALLLLSGREFLALCADPAVAKLLLLDAPSALGYERWREIDERWWLSGAVGLVARARPEHDGELTRQLAVALLGALTSLGHEVAINGSSAVPSAGRTYELLLRASLG